MTRSASLASGLVAVGLLVSCGGDSDGSGGGKTISIGQLPGEAAKAQCELYEKCLGELYSVFNAGEDCVTVTTERVKNGEIGQLQAAVDSGKAKYDGELAARCIDDIRNRSCDQLSNRLSANCDQAAEGSTPSGGDCSYDVECKGAAFCKFDASCPGKCTERQPAGGGCEKSDHCQDGLVCGDSQACVKPKLTGEACGGGVEPDCGPLLLCVGDDAGSSKTGTCKAFSEVFGGQAGAECEYATGALCTPGLTCVYDALPPAKGKCAAPVASGAACKRLSIPGSCPAAEYCDGPATSLDGTCKALPGPGEKCVKVLDDDKCAAYARCQGGTCVALQANGGPCTSASVCYSETCAKGSCKVNACQ